MPGAVYELIQVGGVNDGKRFYIGSTIDARRREHEHRLLKTKSTAGFIIWLVEQGYDFKMRLIYRHTKYKDSLRMEESMIETALDKGEALMNNMSLALTFLPCHRYTWFFKPS